MVRNPLNRAVSLFFNVMYNPSQNVQDNFKLFKAYLTDKRPGFTFGLASLEKPLYSGMLRTDFWALANQYQWFGDTVKVMLL